MNCPRCNNLALNQISVSNLHLDQCKSCEGIWFDQSELRAMLDNGKTSSITPELEKSLQGEIRRNEEPGGFHLKCPRCEAELKRYFYGYNSKVLVDGCESGCGVWIDDSELSILFDYAVEAAAELDPETTKRINARLDSLASARKDREVKFVDSLVTLDDLDGPLKSIGELLQSVASAIYSAQKKLF
jgi:Zn-finger nucleic acid-binding protein